MTRTLDGYLENGKVVTATIPAAHEDRARCLVTVLDESLDDLRARATARMPEAKQSRVSELLAAHGEGELSADQEGELDALLAEAQEMDLRRAEAARILRELGQSPEDGAAS